MQLQDKRDVYFQIINDKNAMKKTIYLHSVK